MKRATVADARERLPAAEEVRVAVVEAGNDPPAVRVDDPCVQADELLRLLVGADVHDAVAPHRDGLRVGVGGVTGPHLRVVNDEIRRDRRLGTGREKREEEDGGHDAPCFEPRSDGGW